jgi:hypothetical protein
MDENDTSMSGESPIDDIESHDNHEVLSNIPDGGLASFVKKSVLDNDDNGRQQQKHRSSEKKVSRLSKSNLL